LFLVQGANALPDLQLSAGQVVLDEETVYIDELVRINVTLINLGTEDLRNVTVGVYSKDPDDGGKLLCPEKETSVGAYNFSYLNFSFKAKDEHRKVKTLWVVADQNDEVKELNEKNNIGLAPLRVLVKEEIGFVLEVVGRGIFLTFISLTLLALILQGVGYLINRFFREKDETRTDGMDGQVETVQNPPDKKISGDGEEVAAVAAAVSAYKRGM
jgi:sodium pump decarboxylase gamma subunit